MNAHLGYCLFISLGVFIGQVGFHALVPKPQSPASRLLNGPDVLRKRLKRGLCIGSIAGTLTLAAALLFLP